MSRFHRTAVALLVLAAGAAPGAVMAQGSAPALRRQVEQLLETGWPRSVQARADAQRCYDRLAPEVSSDWRIPYAYALVQIRQYRYPEAIRLLDEVLAADARNLAAWKLRIWLSVLTKDYGKAMLQMPQLAERFPKSAAAGDAEAPFLELSAFFGRICGFMEGPVQSSVNQTARASCVERVYSGLTIERRSAFENGRKAVLNQFAAMGEETELTAAAAKETNEKIRKHVLEDLQQKSEELGAKADADRARLEELKKSLNYEADKIATAEQGITPQLQGLDSQSVAVRQDIRAIDSRIFQLYDLAGREKDPDKKQPYLNDAAQWQLQRNQRLAVLRDFERRGVELNSQLRSLQRQRRDLERQWQRESGRVEKLQGTLKRVRSEKDKLEGQPADGKSSQVSDQKRLAVAFSAYVPLPISLDEEKARLLGLFR